MRAWRPASFSRKPSRLRRAAKWSREPIELGLLSLADADLTLAGNSVEYGHWRIEQPTLSAVLKDGALTVPQSAGRLFGGSIAAEGGISAAATPALHAKLTLRDADLNQLAVNGAGIGTVAGRFDIDASLASAGRSAADLIAGLSGEATLRGHDGVLSGVNLPAASEWLKLLDRPFDLMALVRSGIGGRTVFSELAGTFHATDGIVRSDDLRLAADGATGQGTATFDLPRWTMASRIELHLTGLPVAPPVAVLLDGPIDAPREVFDVNPLEKFLQDVEDVECR